jgi:methylated-DNA-[protein]-cysteine S-methyltransferase
MSERIVSGVITADWGPIRVAASTRGLVAVDQLVAAGAFADRLGRRFGAPPVDVADAPADWPAAGHLRAGLAALGTFLGGDLAALHAIPIDLADRTGWDRLVLGAVRGIQPGSTASYGEVARMIGKTGAARAVGGAAGRNPLALVIPCHRVIAGDGSLGGYGGGWWGGRVTGLDLKRELLAREGVTIRP